MCKGTQEERENCCYYRIAKHTSEYARCRNNSSRMVLEHLLKEHFGWTPSSTLYQDTCGAAWENLNSIREARMMRIIDSFAVHRSDCAVVVGGPLAVCTCGLHKALAGIGAQ